MPETSHPPPRGNQALLVVEEWQVIHEVDRGIVCTVENASSVLLSNVNRSCGAPLRSAGLFVSSFCQV